LFADLAHSRREPLLGLLGQALVPLPGALSLPIHVPARFLESVIGADMAEVDRVLRDSLASDVALIRQIAEYIVGSGGKRLRPSVLLLVAGACGYRGRDHYTLAAVIEM